MKSSSMMTFGLLLCCFLVSTTLTRAQVAESPESDEKRQARQVDDERAARSLSDADEMRDYQDTADEREALEAELADELMKSAYMETAQAREARQFSSDYSDYSDDSDGSLWESESADEGRPMVKRHFSYVCGRAECNKKCRNMGIGMGGTCGSNGRCYCNRKKT